MVAVDSWFPCEGSNPSKATQRKSKVAQTKLFLSFLPIAQVLKMGQRIFPANGPRRAVTRCSEILLSSFETAS